jgi:hypothetical protein
MDPFAEGDPFCERKVATHRSSQSGKWEAPLPNVLRISCEGARGSRRASSQSV